MVTIDRNIGGVLPYRTVFFPSDEILEQVAERLSGPRMVRLFWTSFELGEAARVVRKQRTATVCVDLARPLDEILAGVSKNGRYDIRQVEKIAGRVRVAQNEAKSAADFLDLYNGFASSKPEISRISAKVLKRYEDNADINLVYFDNLPMCGHVLLRDLAIGRARLLFSASRRLEDRDTARICGMLNRFLHWYEIGAYRDEGFALYDFGGIRRDKSDGITQFKMSFGGTVFSEQTYLCAGMPRLCHAALRIYSSSAMRRRSGGEKIPDD